MAGSGYKCQECGFPFSDVDLPLSVQDHMSDKHGIEYGAIDYIERVGEIEVEMVT